MSCRYSYGPEEGLHEGIEEGDVVLERGGSEVRDRGDEVG